MKIVGIAGGSGAGKSTISYALIDKYPDLFEVVNLDDYQKLKTDKDLPMVGDMINWDHPNIIKWDSFIRDIKSLKSGNPVAIMSWAHRSNPNYAEHGKMIPRTIYPRDILLVEGYLALHNPQVRKLFDHAYYLDLDDKTRNQRRGKSVLTGEDTYETEVLIPMHKKYVEPSKTFADKIIDVSTMSIEEVRDSIYRDAIRL